MHYLRETKWLF